MWRAHLWNQQTLKLEPDNKAAKIRIIQCHEKIKAQKEKEKKTFANMFDKFAVADCIKEAAVEKWLKQWTKPHWLWELSHVSKLHQALICVDLYWFKSVSDIQMNIEIKDEDEKEEGERYYEESCSISY